MVMFVMMLTLHDIEIYYEEIIHCLQLAADTHIPRIPKSALKHYWSVALDDLKANSYAAHSTWISASKPRSGPIFIEKKSAQYKYKIAIKDAARAFESKFTDELLEHYAHKDLNRFWKSWKRLNNRGSVHAAQIDGLSDNFAIANKFAEHFQVCAASAHYVHHNLKCQAVSQDCREYMFNVEDVELAINNNLKPGKAAGIDNIMAEHILHAHPAIITHLKNLFNLMIIHGYVPDKFGCAIIVPLVKNRNADMQMQSSNYRGISLCPVISKVFEYCISLKFEKFLYSHNLQFGFKQNSGCGSAVYVICNRLLNISEKEVVLFILLHLMLAKLLTVSVTIYSLIN